MDKKYFYILKLRDEEGMESELNSYEFDTYEEAKEEAESFQEIYSAAWYYGGEEYYATGKYEHRYDALDDGDFFTDYNSASQFARDRAGDDCVAYGVIKWEIIDIKIVEE